MGKFFLIAGGEDFIVRERAREVIESLCGKPPEDNPALEIIRGDDDTEKAGAVLDKFLAALVTPPFLAPEKFVWLKHFAKFDDAFAEPSTKKNKSRLDRVSDFLKEGLPADLTAVIDGTGLDRRKTFYKLCVKLAGDSGGAVEWHEKNDPKSRGGAQALHQTIRELMGSYGKRIDEAGAAFLAETIGGDAARLRSESAKLAVYLGEQEETATLSDCLAVCSHSSETLAWEFSSALAEKNAVKALKLIPHILETLSQERGSSGGRGELALIAAANSEFKNLLGAKCAAVRYAIPPRADADYFYALFDSRKAAGDSDRFFSLHPFRAFKLWENAARFSDEELSLAFGAIFSADLRMVTGGDMRLALEQLAVKIAGTRKGTHSC